MTRAKNKKKPCPIAQAYNMRQSMWGSRLRVYYHYAWRTPGVGMQRRSGATVRVLGAARARGSVVTTPKYDCRDVGLVWFYSGVIVAGSFNSVSRRSIRGS